MALISFTWEGSGIARLTVAAERLSGSQKVAVLRRALNHTGDRTFTTVRRTLSQQIGAPQHVIARYGKLRPLRASNAMLTYTIVAKGGPVPLKHFKAYQTKKGVSAAPWRNRKLYKSAFIVASLGGHVYWRKGKARLPIERVAGPNIPKEMVKDQTAAAFHATVAEGLPRRVAHEIRRLTDGVLS